MDSRVIKEFFKIFGKGIASLFAFAAIVFSVEWLGNEYLGGPYVGLNILLFCYGVYLVYGVAKYKVEHERYKEQQLIDKLARQDSNKGTVA